MTSLRCRLGHHDWMPWHIDTHEVPLMLLIQPGVSTKVGYDYMRCLPPAWRGCRRCPVLQRKVDD